MVTPALAKHFTARGVGLIPQADGAAALVREHEAAPGGAVEVLLGCASIGSSASRRGEVRVDEASLPFLSDHRVRGTVVVPLVLAIEWLARLTDAAPARPITLHDVRVRRGVLLPGFGAAGERLRIVASGSTLEIHDDSGAARFAARLDGPAPAASAPPGERVDGIALEGAIYRPDRLFHGPRFQVLSELHALSPAGGRATMKGTLDMDWPGGPWRTDAAALDGALQIALLSSLTAGMGPTLPLAIARVTVHRLPSRGPLTCVVETRSRADERATFDAWITAADGALVTELTGVEMFVAPSGTAAG